MLAEIIKASDTREQDKIQVKAQDVAQQRQAMKKAGQAGTEAASFLPPKPLHLTAPQRAARKKPGREPAATSVTATSPASPVDLINRVFSLAEKCGGMEQLKRLVDGLAAR